MHYYNVPFGLPYVALRYANVYRPGQDPHGEAGVVAIFCDNLARGRSSTINGGGEQTRDNVYVEGLHAQTYLPSKTRCPLAPTTSARASRPA